MPSGLPAYFIYMFDVRKKNSVGGSNFSSVDVLMLFKNVLLSNVAISQPWKLSLLLEYVFRRSYLLKLLTLHIYRDFIICSAVYKSCSCIKPTFLASNEYVAGGISS